MSYDSHYGYCDNEFFKVNQHEPFSLFYTRNSKPELVFEFKRKYRGRYPKWDTGMWSWQSSKCLADKSEIILFRNYWCAN